MSIGIAMFTIALAKFYYLWEVQNYYVVWHTLVYGLIFIGNFPAHHLLEYPIFNTQFPWRMSSNAILRIYRLKANYVYIIFTRCKR